MENKHNKYELQQMMDLPLSSKIIMIKQRIREWYEHFDGKVYVSFSGGKDSTVLLHIAREMYPNIKAVYCDTGLEYMEIKQFVSTFKNVTIIKPRKNFKQVILDEGYPYPSKNIAMKLRYAKAGSEWVQKYIDGTAVDSCGRKSIYCIPKKYLKLLDSEYNVSERCCDVMKKQPFVQYHYITGERPIIGILASESRNRKDAWMRTGCNSFTGRHIRSMPMAFWTNEDVCAYIVENNLNIASVYGEIVQDGTITRLNKEYPRYVTTGLDHTGCIFCMFGITKEKRPNRFELLKEQHPKLYEYCMKPIDEGGLGMDEFLTFNNIAH